MTRYELLKENEVTMYQFVKAGILSYQVLRDIEMYEAYLVLESDIKNNELKYILLGEEFELSAKRIEQIVYLMQK